MATANTKAAVESKMNWMGVVLVLVGFMPSCWVEIKQFIVNNVEVIISTIGGLIIIIRTFFTKKAITKVLPK